ncbi:MAG: regulatory protein RecX [Lachnospirales bacterium]
MENKKIITDIQIQRKDEKRRSIYINGVFVFGLTDVDVLFYKLEIGQELSLEKYDTILNDTLYERAKSIALNYISRRIRCEKEVYDKLLEKEVNEEVIDKTMNFLKKYNYINDYDFVKSYVKDKLSLRGYGSKKIFYDLKSLGVSTFIIEDYKSENDLYDIELKIASKLIDKKGKNLDFNEFKDKKKINDYLLRRGFSYDIIKTSLEQYIYENFEG